MRHFKTPVVTVIIEIAILVLCVTELVLGDTVFNIKCKDPCTSLCEKTPADFPNSMYIKSCCQRGCRFFNLVDLRREWEQNYLNITRSTCEASCTEAYTNPNDRYVCNTGCNFMAKRQLSNLLSLPTVTMCTEESIDVLPISSDIPENDILTDPGLRKELLPRWWDSDGFKLPQTHVKTIPLDAKTMDYTLSSDYSEETRQLLCTYKCMGLDDLSIQRKIMGTVFVLFLKILQYRMYLLPSTYLVLILYLVSNFVSFTKESTDKRKKITKMKNKNINYPPKLALFIPDEAVIYKITPPRYNESFSHVI